MAWAALTRSRSSRPRSPSSWCQRSPATCRHGGPAASIPRSRCERADVHNPMSPAHFVLAALWSFWRTGRPVERLGYVVGTLLLASGLIHLCILAIGGGSWGGPVSLRKPMTFGVSFGATLITIVWVTSLLRL